MLVVQMYPCFFQNNVFFFPLVTNAIKFRIREEHNAVHRIQCCQKCYIHFVLIFHINQKSWQETEGIFMFEKGRGEVTYKGTKYNGVVECRRSIRQTSRASSEGLMPKYMRGKILGARRRDSYVGQDAL